MAAAGRRLGAAAVLRERDQQRAPVRLCQRLALCQGRDQRVHRHGRTEAVNPERSGTKVAAHHLLEIGPGASASIAVRLSAASRRRRRRRVQGAGGRRRSRDRGRLEEADEYYATVIPPTLNADASMVMRQALAGLLWSKQYYEYDVHRWLREHNVNPWHPAHRQLDAQRAVVPHDRRRHHLDAGQVGVPVVRRMGPRVPHGPLSLVDVDFAKEQVELLLRTRYMHPNGQIPAYEWNFSDVNPPVTPWAALYVYEREAEIRGEGDHEFLARVFDRLLTNFTWWVNRKDPDGRNLFQGGFLGLDNIGIFDRSAPLPGGGTLEQADGTAWMALYCQWMLQIAVELSKHDRAYVDMAYKFIAHFEWISVAMNPPESETELWDEQDGFYYDVMRTSDDARSRCRVRSLVGLLPMCASTVFEVNSSRSIRRSRRWPSGSCNFGDVLPALAHLFEASPEGHRLVSLVDEQRLRRILSVMLDEDEFLGAHGIRAISRRHLDEPCRVRLGGQRVQRPLPAGGVRHRDVRRQLQLARPGLVPDEPRDRPRRCCSCTATTATASRSSARPDRAAR